jgi:hypothetical protein
MVSHIETKKPIFNNFWWFNQKPLKMVEQEEWGNLGDPGWRKKLQELPGSCFSWKALWVRTVDVLVSCGQKCWVPLVGITGYISYAPALVIRQLGGIQHIPRTMGLAEFSRLFKDQSVQEVLETIKRDWNHLTLIQKESKRLRDPSSSRGYERWRNVTPTVDHRMPRSEDGPSQITTELLKRKKVSNLEDLMEQLEKLQIELGKSKGDKAALEVMMMKGDKSRVFLNEQLESIDAKIFMFELQLSKGKAAMEESEKERGRLNLNWGQCNSELEALKSNFNDCQENTEHHQEKFKHVQEELMDRNNTLNQNNLLLMEKMAKIDKQMDEAAIHAHIIRANAQNVGRDILRYRHSLVETDAFLRKIEHRGLAFLPLASDMDEGED